MLHLNFARADLACATHSNVAQAGAQSGAGHAHHVVSHSHHATTAQSCQTPVQVDCCQALVACSITFALDDAAHAVAAIARHDAALAVAQSEPISRVTAPEPPPPKA
jgi:hypothetical protein